MNEELSVGQIANVRWKEIGLEEVWNICTICNDNCTKYVELKAMPALGKRKMVDQYTTSRLQADGSL